jgi:general secretion pathway protein L
MVHRLAALLPFTERQEVASPLSYAASLVNALQGLALPFNLLPVERRKVISPWLWVPSIVLVVALAGLGLALAYYQDYENKRLLELLDKEAAALQPVLLRKKALDREMGLTQKRIDYLVQLGASPQQDLETLKELTRILPQNAWLARLELTRKTATLAGETDQATELLRVLDASPYFQGSEFLGTPGRSANGKEAFQIRTQRREIPRVAPAPTPTPSVGGPNVTPQRPVMPVPGMAPTMPITGPPPGMAPGMPNNPGGPR